MRFGIAALLLASILAGSVFVLSQGEGASPNASLEVALAEIQEVASDTVARSTDAFSEGEGTDRSRAERMASEDREAERAGRKVYYQFIDDAGTVRFVGSLDAVPPHLRETAGRVETAGAITRTVAAPSAGDRPYSNVPDAPRRAALTDVTVFTAPWCGWCRKTLAWLDQRGVTYVNKDIEAAPRHREELIRKTGRTTIPVVEIDGALIRGYSPGKMENALGL